MHPDAEFRCNYRHHSSERRPRILSAGAGDLESDAGASTSKTVTIYTAYSRLSGKTFLWPVGIVGQPGQNKRTENWYRTAHEAAEEAMHSL